MSAPDVPERQRSDLGSLQRLALIAGAAALAVCAGYGYLFPASFFRAYLASYLLCLGVTLGCMVLMMIRHLTGGAWGLWLRPLLEAAASLVPLMAVLFLPLLLGLKWLYPWHPQFVGVRPELTGGKAIWLTEPYFLARAAVYFAVWTLFAVLLLSGPRGWTTDLGQEPPRRFRVISALGLLFYGLTITGAAIDWVMSLEPNWWSTMYAPKFAIGQLLTGFAFAVLAAALFQTRLPREEKAPTLVLRDLGNLTLAFTMLWAYMAFSEFLLIWAGNLPAETSWFARRVNGGWMWVGLGLILFQFALPFLMLLSRTVKQNPRLLATVALLALAMRFVDMLWLTVPSYDDNSWDLLALEPALLLGLGGVWFAAFLWRLQRRPLFPAPTGRAEVLAQ